MYSPVTPKLEPDAMFGMEMTDHRRSASGGGQHRSDYPSAVFFGGLYGGRFVVPVPGFGAAALRRDLPEVVGARHRSGSMCVFYAFCFVFMFCTSMFDFCFFCFRLVYFFVFSLSF